MMSFDVVGWAYEADVHCPNCAVERFGSKALDAGVDDNEGNEVTPIFAGDCEEDESCGDCHNVIWESDEDYNEDEEA